MSQNTMFVIEIPKFTDTAARKNIFRHKRSPAMSSYRKLGHERVELVYKHELLKVISLVGRSFSVQCDVTRGSRCPVCIEIPIVMDSSISITPMTCNCEGDHVVPPLKIPGLAPVIQRAGDTRGSISRRHARFSCFS